MTLELESQNHTKPHLIGDLPAPKADHANESRDDIDMLKRDRFELLSAYLDGEVTAAERRQVEDWLANDPEIQRLYGRLLKLRQGLHTLPVPPSEQPAEQNLQQVYGRLNRRRNRAMGWGGAAIAALFIGALSGVLPSRQSIQIAKSPEPLMVALNTPVVEIPKAAVAAPKNPVGQTGY